jgi:hypothetical protein
VYQHVLLQTSSPVMMVSVFHMLSSVMGSQIVRTSQMNHLAVEENAKVMNGSVGKSGSL